MESDEVPPASRSAARTAAAPCLCHKPALPPGSTLPIRRRDTISARSLRPGNGGSGRAVPHTEPHQQTGGAAAPLRRSARSARGGAVPAGRSAAAGDGGGAEGAGGRSPRRLQAGGGRAEPRRAAGSDPGGPEERAAQPGGPRPRRG